MSNDYLVGETARLSVAITDSTAAPAAPADPGVLRLKVKSPNNQVQTYTYGASGEVIRDATGLFHADILLNAPGTWAWRWETDAPNAGADEGTLAVRPTRFKEPP